MRQFVYLSGPMMGYKHNEVNDWRAYASEKLNNEYVKCLSPMRTWTEEHLPDETDKWINRRDYFDCTRASCVLVNITMMKHLSIGTIMEIAWAYQAQIPVICICNEGGPQKHPMLRDSITHEVYSLDEGIAFVKELLSE
jgi:nucleoside 2-deoxyribosyltransferase